MWHGLDILSVKTGFKIIFTMLHFREAKTVCLI